MSPEIIKSAGFFRSLIAKPPIVKFESTDLTCLCPERHSLVNIQPLPLMVIFVFPAHEIYLGSTVLRLKQVAEYVRLIPGTVISMQPIESLTFKDLKNAILIFTKVGLRHIKTETLIMLRGNGNIVILDELDGERSLSKLADYVLRPSILGEIQSEFQVTQDLPVSTLPDRRLRDRVNSKRHNMNFRCIYIGSETKYLFNQTKARDLIQTKFISPYTWLGSTPPVWSRNLDRYNYHLIATPFESYDETPKTLTKFTTSLLLNAIPIVGVWETHLDPYLTKDYPYRLLRGTSNELLDQLLEFKRKFSHGIYDDLFIDLKANNQKLLCETNFILEWHTALSKIKRERSL